MSAREDFKPYIDGNGLTANQPVPEGVMSGSDNGPMYTSEYYICLKVSGELSQSDRERFNYLITRCMDDQGRLNRTFVDQHSGQEGPDDYYGVLSACVALENTTIPRKFLKCIIKHLGFMNNTRPYQFNWSAFLARQPQLIAAMVSASFPKRWNLLHLLARLTFLPFYLVAALVILTSCRNTPKSDTDARRLAWHLIRATETTSLMCSMAAKSWRKRLVTDYPLGMSSVASEYYQPNGLNPFTKHLPLL